MPASTEITDAPSHLSPELTAKLAQLAPGRYCFHRSWGYGKVKAHSEYPGQVIIDFKTKKNHAMAFEYAAESLVSLPDEHIFARKSEDLPGLKGQLVSDPLAVVQCCIESFGEQATTDVIQSAIVPDLLTEPEWKKWWDGAKRALKKHGLFHVPSRKSDPFRVLTAKVELGVQSLAKFRAASGPEQQLAGLSEVVKNWSEIKDPAVVTEIVDTISATLSKIPKSQLAVAIELAISRDELLVLAGLPVETERASLLSLVPTTPRAFADTLEKISGPRQTKLLRALQESGSEIWAPLMLQALPQSTARMADSITTAFASVGRAHEVVEALQRLMRERNVSTDLLYWLCKNRDELFAPIFEPHLIMAILSVLEKDQFSDIKRGTKLYDLMHGDKELIATLLKGAHKDDVRDVTRAIILSPVFKELDKRSLLATIIKLFPDMQELVVGDRTSSEDTTLIVSWSSLDRRKMELEEIITRKIPENSKEIGIARSYGDLRENHEFKAAKEMQTVLMRRKAELESILLRSQGTDFSNVETNVVNIGTRVTLTETKGGKPLVYTILGAWDSDPAQGIVSYLTPLAQALMKHKVGAVLPLRTEEGGEHEVRIEKIESYK